MQTSFSTKSLDPTERIDAWEAFHRAALVGLNVRSYADEGLLATFINTELGDGVGVAAISGNEHFVERPPELLRAEPKDSVLFILVVAGEGMMYNPGSCLPLRPGEMIISGSRRPFLLGYTSEMSQVMLDVPRELLDERYPEHEYSSPVLLESGASPSATAASTLAREMRRVVGAGHGDSAALVDLLGAVVSRRSPPGTVHLAVAREHIRRHLTDPDLGAASVAVAVGISPRHLGRLFAGEGTTVPAYIREQRLDAALVQLTTSPHAKVSDVAARWAFSSQAHFTRAFKDRFGMTPSELRRQRAAG